jgi:hypothetical protein
MNQVDNSIYYITISNVNGKAIVMLPQPQLQQGLDISRLAAGTYFITITDKNNKIAVTKKFIKQ